MIIIMTNGFQSRTFANCKDVIEANVLIRYFGYNFTDENGENWELTIKEICE